MTALALTLVAVASAASGRREFYLDVRPHQCLIAAAGAGNKGYKTVLQVPCSSSAHNLEAYAVGHGGWGLTPPSQARVRAIVRSTCLGLYQRLTGHAIERPYGWDAFAPDPGAETRRYGDRIVCSLRTWPALRPLGAGWHVR